MKREHARHINQQAQENAYERISMQRTHDPVTYAKRMLANVVARAAHGNALPDSRLLFRSIHHYSTYARKTDRAWKKHLQPGYAEQQQRDKARVNEIVRAIGQVYASTTQQRRR
jgi:hypothetical protein